MKAAVQLANVSLTLGGTMRLKGVTQTLPSEGITALVGPNGAGKSLLLATLHGLYGSTGKIRWHEDLVAAPRALMRQRPAFLNRTVLGNLTYSLHVAGWKAKAAKARAMETLDWLDLAHLASLPAPMLSPGIQARVALARALAIAPATLLLDEPTASLDPEASLAVEGLISYVAQEGTKVILVSHSLGQVRRLAQDVMLLDQGRSLEFAPTEAFFTTPKAETTRSFLHAAGFWNLI